MTANRRRSVGEGRPATWFGRLVEASRVALALVVADVVIRSVPFAVVAKRVTAPMRRRAAPGEYTPLAKRLEWGVAAARRRIPWTIPCLAEATAVNRLLARRGVPSELWLGAAPAGAFGIEAHAWLVAGGRVVTGRAQKASVTPLYALTTAPPAGDESGVGCSP